MLQSLCRRLTHDPRDGSWKNHTFDLGSEQRETQDGALRALTDMLTRVHGDDPTLRHAQGASRIPVLVHADRETKWTYVRRVMQACAEFRIHRVQFAVRKPSDPKNGR